jgi:hypothetical protein
LAGARRQRDVGVLEKPRQRGRGVGAHQPIGAAMAKAHLGETVEIAQEVAPLGGDAGFAHEIVELLLHRKRQERAEDVAADRRVGGMEDRPRAHDRLGSAEEVLDLQKIAIAQNRLQRRELWR